jgi:hypothetical protein
MVISAKIATQKAAEYLKEVKEVYSITLEEIELSQNEEYWSITLSYRSNSIFDNGTSWKIFKVDATSGKVISMKAME